MESFNYVLEMKTKWQHMKHVINVITHVDLDLRQAVYAAGNCN